MFVSITMKTKHPKSAPIVPLHQS